MAGAPLAVSATIDTGAPVGYTVTGTPASGSAQFATSSSLTAAATTTCGSGVLNPSADTNELTARCRFQATGYWSVRVTIRDASGNQVSRAKTVRVVPDTAAPHANVPVVRSVVGGSLGASVPVTVSLSGRDIGTGIARYRVGRSIDGGAWATLASSATGATYATRLAFGHSYRFRVQAVDRAGNSSAWAYGDALRGYLRQETSATVTGSWHLVSDATASGGHLRRSSAAGASTSYAFSGRGIALVGLYGPAQGTARVYVDGVLVGTVNFNLATAAPRRIAYQRTWASIATHRITIRVVGGGWVSVDAFVVLR
jgi:hypothetical protein